MEPGDDPDSPQHRRSSGAGLQLHSALGLLRGFGKSPKAIESLLKVIGEDDSTAAESQISPISALITAVKSGDEEVFGSVAIHFENIYREGVDDRSMKADPFESEELVALLLEALPSYSPEFACRAAIVLWLLARNDHNKSHICKHGGVKLALDLMTEHHMMVEMVQELLAVLRNIAHCPDGSAQLISSGVPQVLAAMQVHTSSEAVQVEGLAVLGNLAKGCPEGRISIIREGAITKVVTVMQQHVRSELVQRVALITLWKVVYRDADGTAVVIQEGGMLPIVTAMKTHPNSAAVQIRALRAIDELIRQNNDNVLLLILEGGVHPLFMPSAFVSSAPLRTELLRLIQTHCRPVLRTLLAVRSCKTTELNVRLALLYLCDSNDLVTSGIFSSLADVVCITAMLTEASAEIRADGSRAVLHLLSSTGSPTSFSPPILQPSLRSPQNFEAFVNDDELSDVTFVVEGKDYHAHRIVLKASTSSSVFSAMLSSPMRESMPGATVPIEGLRYPIFCGLMQFVYTGKVVVPPEDAAELMLAADQFLVIKLQEHCVAVLAGILDKDNVWEFLKVAHQCNLAADQPEEPSPGDMLKDACICFLVQHLTQIVHTEEFLHQPHILSKMIAHKVWSVLPKPD